MVFFKDLALIKEIKEKKFDKEFDYPHDHFFIVMIFATFIPLIRQQI